MVDGGRGEISDKARDEFFSEAQELVDALGRDLLALDEAVNRGLFEADRINEVFRGVHTLKGLSGLFGATRMAGLSHQLEDALDDLRLGRIELTSAVLDLLFQAVLLYGKLLAAEKGEVSEPGQEVDDLLLALGQISARPAGGGGGVIAQYDLDPGVFGVLTEYEEHRLRTTVQQGLELYRIRVRFSLATIDSALDELKASAKPHGEIITYLPTGTCADAETIELEILLASRATLDILRGAIAAPIEEVPRRAGATRGPPRRAVRPQADPVRAPLAHRSPPVAVAGDVAGALVSVVDPPSTVPEPGIGQVRAPLQRAATAVTFPSEVSLRSISQTVRVDIRKLDRLMTIVGELANVRTAIARLTDHARNRPAASREIAIELQRLNR
ncbi:MAG: Hpt domain-containing protein, partial [Polyangiaceae bacterium]|nr:Hpt domain-containing protein [Polyangiaceae bacterium]